jgi:hypothetical protein
MILVGQTCVCFDNEVSRMFKGSFQRGLTKGVRIYFVGGTSGSIAQSLSLLASRNKLWPQTKVRKMSQDMPPVVVKSVYNI